VLETAIIGAGPGGLAVAACLERAGKRATILERSANVGSSWRGHYERLHLHTPRDRSELPGLAFPKGTPRWPSRASVVEYLESYARHFALDVRFDETVERIERDGDGWSITTDRGEHRAKNVVVATGNTRVPVVPEWPGAARFRGTVVHSSQYKNGEPYRGKRVLVVGFGNSGGEIAIDLYEHGARPTLAVRSPVNVVTREIFGLPALEIGIALSWVPARIADAISVPLTRLSIGDIRELGFRTLPYGPITQIRRHGRIPLIDVGTIALIREGHVGLRPNVRELEEEDVVFGDGSRQAFDAIVAATGYEPRVDQLLSGEPGALDERGRPKASGVRAAPGLYFCGFYVSPTGMLRELALEAERIAADIVRA
jgi:indole-3-pyruvate monooxygenase